MRPLMVAVLVVLLWTDVFDAVISKDELHGRKRISYPSELPLKVRRCLFTVQTPMGVQGFSPSSSRQQL